VLAQEKDRASPVTRAAAWKRNMVSVYSLALRSARPERGARGRARGASALALNELNPSRGGSATPAFGA